MRRSAATNESSSVDGRAGGQRQRAGGRTARPQPRLAGVRRILAESCDRTASCRGQAARPSHPARLNEALRCVARYGRRTACRREDPPAVYKANGAGAGAVCLPAPRGRLLAAVRSLTRSKPFAGTEQSNAPRRRCRASMLPGEPDGHFPVVPNLSVLCHDRCTYSVRTVAKLGALVGASN